MQSITSTICLKRSQVLTAVYKQLNILCRAGFLVLAVHSLWKF